MARAHQPPLAVASGVESEAQLPFAALGELAAPMLGGLGELPEPQAAAISSALALWSPGRWSTSAWRRSPAFSASCARPPAIAAADRRRRRSLARPPLRRVPRIRRPGGWGAWRGAAGRGPARGRRRPVRWRILRAARLTGLGRAESLALLADAELAAPAADAVLELSLGNPLALRELPWLLSDEQRSGTRPDRSATGRRRGARRGVRAPGCERRAGGRRPAAGRGRRVRPRARADDGRCPRPRVSDEALEACETTGLLETGLTASASCIHCCAASSTELRRPPIAGARTVRSPITPRPTRAPGIWPRPRPARRGDRRRARPGRRARRVAARTRRPRTRSSGRRRSAPSLAARRARLFAAGLAAAMGGAYESAAALLERAGDTDDPSRCGSGPATCWRW